MYAVFIYSLPESKPNKLARPRCSHHHKNLLDLGGQLLPYIDLHALGHFLICLVILLQHFSPCKALTLQTHYPQNHKLCYSQCDFFSKLMQSNKTCRTNTEVFIVK